MNARDSWFAAGLLAGCLVAIAVTWLFAPEAGRDLFGRLVRELRRTRDEARDAGKRAEADVLARYRDVRANATAPVAPVPVPIRA